MTFVQDQNIQVINFLELNIEYKIAILYRIKYKCTDLIAIWTY